MLASSDGSILYANTVTTSDSVALPSVTRGLYIGTGGNVTIGWGIKQNGVYPANTTFTNVPTGVVLPVRALYVYSTGTTANNILALY